MGAKEEDIWRSLAAVPSTLATAIYYCAWLVKHLYTPIALDSQGALSSNLQYRHCATAIGV